MRLTSSPTLLDDLDTQSLHLALDSQIEVLRRQGETTLTFGPRKISAKAYADALTWIRRESELGQRQLHSGLMRNFDFLEVYGGPRWGEIQLTGYYTPEISGAKIATPIFTEPLYERPRDLVRIAASQFDERISLWDTLRGRLRILPNRELELVPFFSRQEIYQGALNKRGLEIAWVDPIDAFFLQIQGSGVIKFLDGTSLTVGYADQNGHKYEAIGRFLLDKIPLEEMTQAKLEAYLRGLEKDEISALLSKNPSFVFFQTQEGPPIAANGTPVIAGRTIATDSRYFPKASLAFLRFKKPDGSISSRFVVDQDTGGAIKGGGRADLYVGRGAEAKQFAGDLKYEAWLYYLVPREEFLSELGPSARNRAPQKKRG